MARILSLALGALLVASFAAMTVSSTSHTKFDSGSSMLMQNQSFSHTFDAAGTYKYHCKPHPFMQGTVTVSASATLSGDVAVEIKGFEYAPKAITVKPGTKVTWTNKDSEGHTVTEDSDSPGPKKEGGSSPAPSGLLVLLAVIGVAAFAARRRN
jgi:plastocyanin